MLAHSLPDETELPDAHRERVERHMAALRELGEIGLGLARALGRRATVAAEADEERADAAALAFSRVARAVGQAYAQEVRLSEGLLALDAAAAAQAGGGFNLAGAAARLQDRLLAMLGEDPDPGAEGAEDEAGEIEDGGVAGESAAGVEDPALDAFLVRVRRALEPEPGIAADAVSPGSPARYGAGGGSGVRPPPRAGPS